jgi:signal transduction histidine kinase
MGADRKTSGGAAIARDGTGSRRKPGPEPSASPGKWWIGRAVAFRLARAASVGLGSFGARFRQLRGGAPSLVGQGRLSSLTGQFMVTSAAALIIGGLTMGAWVTAKIQARAEFHTGSAAARYIDEFISPHMIGIGSTDALSPEQTAAVDHVTNAYGLKTHVISIKIWSTSGTLLYTTNGQQVGRRYGENPALLRALKGEVSVEFDKLDHEESHLEYLAGHPLLEIYGPIRNAADQVIGVAEFYEDATELANDLFTVKVQTWIVTGLMCATMILILFWVVHRGSDTIDWQRQALTERVRELSSLLEQNRELRGRVERGSRLAAERNEAFLRRIGADLHDGPAQLVSVALLRLDALVPPAHDGPASAVDADFAAVRGALAEVMREVRDMCSGLVMPQFENLTLEEALKSVIRDHERRTRTSVARHLADLPADAPEFVKISLCRFVQEGLSNAFRHAAGKGQGVSSWVEAGTLFVQVRDEGLGFPACHVQGDRTRLGLIGMRSRIESLGGSLHITSAPGDGTRVTAELPIAARLEGEAS